MANTIPEDIQQAWFNVVRRLRNVAIRENHGSFAILTIHILVDGNGKPRLWSTPTCRPIEPKHSSGDILRILSSVLGEDVGSDE